MKKKKQTLLWQIQSEKTAQPSYLFGTMHVRDPRAFVYMDLLQMKIRECAVFAAEMNIDEAQEADPQIFMLKDGLTLEALLKPKIFKRLDKIFKEELGQSLMVFNHHLPMLLSNLLIENTLKTDAPVSLDIALWQYAKEQDKILTGVESVEEHLAVLPKIPLDYQIQTLKDIAKGFGKFRKKVSRMADLYQSGNIQKLYKITKKNIGGLRKMMIYDRNHLMTRNIEEIVKEQTAVCAVGAAHLAGKEGILRLLKQKGFKIKPLKNCPPQNI